MSKQRTPEFQVIFPTPLGWVGFAGSLVGMHRLVFGHDSSEAVRKALGVHEMLAPLPPWANDAERMIRAYCEGECQDLSSIPLDLEEATPFQKRVRRQLQRTAYGSTTTYGDLAKASGRPGASRAVGTVMSKNPVPLVIPCHRVLAVGGRLGGFSAPQGLSMKRRLLEMEQQGRESALAFEEPRRRHA